MISHPNEALFIRENATSEWPAAFLPPFNSVTDLANLYPLSCTPPSLTPRPPHASPHEIPLPSNTNPISVFQNNVNRSSPIMHAILNEYAPSKDLILIQEPWIGPIGTGKSDTCADGNPIFGLPHQSSWSSFHPSQITSDAGTNPRVVAYVNRRLKKLQVSVR